MNMRWKDVAKQVDTLDPVRQEQVAQVVLDYVHETDNSEIQTILAEAEADVAAGRIQDGGDRFWDERKRKMLASGDRTL